jgi:predicted NAD/FAD-dependent oxidoreductase
VGEFFLHFSPPPWLPLPNRYPKNLDKGSKVRYTSTNNKKGRKMADYDVWLVHEYWTWYTAFHAEDKDQVMSLIIMRLDEENLPKWLLTSAQEIKIEQCGELT